MPDEFMGLRYSWWGGTLALVCPWCGSPDPVRRLPRMGGWPCSNSWHEGHQDSDRWLDERDNPDRPTSTPRATPRGTPHPGGDVS